MRKNQILQFGKLNNKADSLLLCSALSADISGANFISNTQEKLVNIALNETKQPLVQHLGFQ